MLISGPISFILFVFYCCSSILYMLYFDSFSLGGFLNVLCFYLVFVFVLLFLLVFCTCFFSFSFFSSRNEHGIEGQDQP